MVQKRADIMYAKSLVEELQKLLCLDSLEHSNNLDSMLWR